MALSNEEFRNRVLAAGALHGRGMREIRDLLAEFGTEKTLAEAVANGRKPQNKRNIRDLAEALEVPRAWFTEPDWRLLLVEAPGLPADEIERDLDAHAPRSETTDQHSEGPGREAQK